MKKAIVVSLALALASFGAAAHAEGSAPASLYVFGGEAVSNSISDLKSRSWGVEQQTDKWSLGYVNEGHQNGDKRDGIYAQLRFPYQFSKDVVTAFSLGPYFTATTITEPDGIHYQDHYSWAAIASASVTYAVTERVSTQLRWSHVLYADQNKDADIFLIGTGFTPKAW